VAFGTLTLHADNRDVELDLISHDCAARVINHHTGLVSASGVFFRGDELSAATFDGHSTIFSIDTTKIVSIEWTPYPEGDGTLSDPDDDDNAVDVAMAVAALIDALRRQRAAAGGGVDNAGDEPAMPTRPGPVPNTSQHDDAQDTGESDLSDASNTGDD
jgi:hypothetical protein